MVESRTLGKRAMPMSVKITKAAFKRDLMMSRRIDGALCALLSITVMAAIAAAGDLPLERGRVWSVPTSAAVAKH